MPLAVINLIFGNGVYILVHVLSAIKQKEYKLAPFAILMPFYWLFISLATVRALIQFINDPYHWEKTKHGLS